MPSDLAVLLPFQHRIRRQFGSIVTGHKAGITKRNQPPAIPMGFIV